MGKLKLMTIIGTRQEIIRLSATIKCCDRYFEQVLVHTGQMCIRDSSIYACTDKLMLKQMLGADAVGHYSLASTVRVSWAFIL